MAEIAQAFGWAVTAMKADSALMSASTGGVWQGFAPIATATPYAIVTSQSATDSLTANVKRLYVQIVLQIKAIGPSSVYTSLVTIADRIDTLFGRLGNVTLASGGVVQCYREQEISYDELVNGIAFSHLGGLYRVYLQGS